MAARNAWNYKGCTVSPEHDPQGILVGCNNSINRYLRDFWRVTFPDGTWTRVGTKFQAKRAIHRVGYRHGVAGV